MKKFITLLLVLTGMVSTASAARTIYVRCATKPYIWAWNTENPYLTENTSWPGDPMNYVGKLGTLNLYSYTVDADEFTMIFSQENNHDTKSENLSVSEDSYYDLVFGSSYTKLENNAELSSVQIATALGGWVPVSMTSEGNNVYTYTWDLSNKGDDQEFKFIANDTWLGLADAITVDAPDNWITGSDNLCLHHGNTGFNTYKITATWTPNEYDTYQWTLKVEGVEKRTFSIVGMETSGSGAGWSRDWDMTPTGNNGEYQVIKEFEIPVAGTYQYKMRSNHNWSIFELPGSKNAYYEFKDAGKYRLTFTANIENYNISLYAEKVVELGSSGMGTFASNHVCDFSGDANLTAYAVSEVAGGYAKLTAVTGVPNGNGVVLIGTEGKHYVPFGDAVSLGPTNLLQAVTNADGYTVGNNGDAYILYEGEFHPANAGTIPFGKAYLPKASVGAARALSLAFDDITGINEVNATKTTAEGCYNLAGQRVAAPAKGLYIVNGKKVIIK